MSDGSYDNTLKIVREAAMSRISENVTLLGEFSGYVSDGEPDIVPKIIDELCEENAFLSKWLDIFGAKNGK